MLRAFSLFKESNVLGILAQVWVPVRRGDKYIMSTSDQPFLLDKSLAGYREVSRTYTFSAELKPGVPLGVPGRVFVSKTLEWTSNVVYYSKSEYLRMNHAINHAVRGSIAFPIFDPSNMSCCAVLELVTVTEKANFDSEMDLLCRALQAVNLRVTEPPRLVPQCISINQRAALDEISNMLRTVCHAHRLPLALTWIPYEYAEESVDDVIEVHLKESKRLASKCILRIESTACYINDREMQGFVRACAENYIMEGQGIVGKALQTNHPFFSEDVKAYDILEYPLVHHARKYGLNAAVAIRLQSTYTEDNDYVLEFFLPVSLQGSSEQQLLLNNLSVTMQRICKSLRTVSDTKLVGEEGVKAGFQIGALPTSETVSIVTETSQIPFPECISTDKTPFNGSCSISDGVDSRVTLEQVNSLSRRKPERKRSTAEKNVSLSVLQQYFSGSLKDAAKSLGVCPTTLKRICRQHGISRWPSRKINKVNHSLRKIQTVLDSVQGVEVGLKFDPLSGGFEAIGCIIDGLDSQKSSPLQKGILPAKNSECVNQVKEFIASPYSALEVDGFTVKLEEEDQGIQTYGVAKFPGIDTGLLPQASIGFQPRGSCDTSSIFAAADGMDKKLEGIDRTAEQNQPSCSSMTDLSNGSGSWMQGISSHSPTINEEKHQQLTTRVEDDKTKITVKATYKGDKIRFKFNSSSGYSQLCEEVAKRFRLQEGAFQLKYLDDEEEWVMLVSDSDLQECMELLEHLRTQNLKLLVRDTHVLMASSGSSNCLMAGSS